MVLTSLNLKVRQSLEYHSITPFLDAVLTMEGKLLSHPLKKIMGRMARKQVVNLLHT